MSEMSKEFLTALGRDPAAALRFSGLTEGEKQTILESVKRAPSAREVERIVGRI